MATEKRAPVDWEAIEGAYRAGQQPLRAIGVVHSISHAAIRKRALRDGWERSSHVREQVVLTPREPKPAAGFIYVIYIDAPDGRIFKIGMSAHFSARFDAHQCASPFPLAVACAFFVGDMRAEERFLHRRFADQRVRGEWFRLGDADLAEIAARVLLA